MNSKIEVFGRVSLKLKALAEFVAKQVLIQKQIPDGVLVAISFVSEKEIQRLNREYRNTDRVTDVLSFPAFDLKADEKFDTEKCELFKNEDGLIPFGDMAICVKQLKRQAKQYGVILQTELKKLVIHSMLHLMGYDHIADSDYEIMKTQEELLDKNIKID